MLEVELITALPRLCELESALDALFAADDRATPFQSPAWLLPWAEQFVPDSQLRTLVVRRGEQLVAWLPLWLDESGGRPVLRWLGSGLSDRLDALLDASVGPAALERALPALAELAASAELELDELPEGSPLIAPLQALGARVAGGCVCPVLPLAAEPSPFGRAARWLARNVQQTERRLARQGGARSQLAGPADLERCLAAFFELHAARWRARGEPGVLAEPAVLAFHRAAAPRLLSRGLLELELLFQGEQPLAATYVLRRFDAHLYLFGFDPGRQQLSLGSWAVWRSIERAARAGLRRYDFLRGCEPYKYAFGAENTESARCVRPAGRAALPGPDLGAGFAAGERDAPAQAASAGDAPSSWPRTSRA